MINARRLIIAPKVSVISTGEVVCVIQIDRYLINIRPQAFEVLVGYLKVIKAYFVSFPSARKITSSFYLEIGKKLSQNTQQTGSAIESQDITNIIAQFGCVNDWKEWYHN